MVLQPAPNALLHTTRERISGLRRVGQQLQLHMCAHALAVEPAGMRQPAWKTGWWYYLQQLLSC
jgi:hypothetical protein